jgi:uncharacterized metal-binding protein
MAKGSVHALATVVAGGVITPGLVWLGHVEVVQALAFAGGCLVGLIINPDLDIRRFTHAEEVVRVTGGRAGGFLAGVWYLVWWPYAHLVPFHRHPISHLPLVGTVGRVLYLGALLGLLYGLLGLLLSLPPLPVQVLTSTNFWWGFGGLALVDSLHTLLDLI